MFNLWFRVACVATMVFGLGQPAASKRKISPEMIVKLALGASKNAYLSRHLVNMDWLGTRKVEGNSGSAPQLVSVVIGTLADLVPSGSTAGKLISYLPTQINLLPNWPVCSTWHWRASWHSVKGSRLLLLKNPNQKVAVFAFRGEAAYSLKNIEESVVANYTRGRLPVHTEFLESLDPLWGWFKAEYEKVPSDHVVIVTGHDTGGAQAYIAAAKAGDSLGRRPDAVVTFGAQPVGNLAFRDLYEAKVGCARTLSIVTLGDVFGRLLVGAIRPCADVPVDGGERPTNHIVEFLKSKLLAILPEIAPQIVEGLLPSAIKEKVHQVVPPKKIAATIRNSMTTIDKLYDTILDFQYHHNLYGGYDNAITEAYKGKDISFGCD